MHYSSNEKSDYFKIFREIFSIFSNLEQLEFTSQKESYGDKTISYIGSSLYLMPKLRKLFIFANLDVEKIKFKGHHAYCGF